MRTEIHTKTQVHNAGPHSNPFQQSRNVFIVSNDEDRPGRSFDDLFEDPDAEQHQAPPETRDSKPIELEQESAGWDEYDLPDFVTPDDLSPAEPAAIEPLTPERQMSNVNVIGAVQPISDSEFEPSFENSSVSEVTAEPEFVPPMDAFSTCGQSASYSAPAGRLYRSIGAEGPAAAMAIPALAAAPTAAGPIRISSDSVNPATQNAPSPAAPLSRPVATAYGRTATLDDKPASADDDVASTKSPRLTLRPSAQAAGLTYNGAAVVILASTILVGFVDALVNHRLGWLTGIALVASSIYAALHVRLADLWAPAILAPLGFMAATLTAGQLTRGSSGSWFVREGYMIFRSLAVNAPWIIGATVISAGIAYWRRRQTQA